MEFNPEKLGESCYLKLFFCGYPDIYNMCKTYILLIYSILTKVHKGSMKSWACDPLFSWSVCVFLRSLPVMVLRESKYWFAQLYAKEDENGLKWQPEWKFFGHINFLGKKDVKRNSLFEVIYQNTLLILTINMLIDGSFWLLNVDRHQYEQEVKIRDCLL